MNGRITMTDQVCAAQMQPSQLSPIRQKIHEIASLLTGLDSSIESLAKAVEPILCPLPATENKQSPTPDEHGSSVYRALAEIAKSVDRQISTIKSIRDQVEA
jgi:hypothetical protein